MSQSQRNVAGAHGTKKIFKALNRGGVYGLLFGAAYILWVFARCAYRL